jgi:hypothetical protein
MGYRGAGVIAWVVCAVSCGGAMTPVSPSATGASGIPEPPGGWATCGGLAGQRNGRLTADVNGVAYNANYTVGADYSSSTGRLTILTQDCGTPRRGISLQAEASGPGTFAVSSGTGVSEAGPPAGPMHWRLDQPGGGGTMTLAAVSATRLTGTFSFVAPADTATGATGTRTAAGEFDIVLR